MNATHRLTRQVFTKKRQLDFFTEFGLTAQIGYGRRWWPAVLLKELVDNALDAAEVSDTAPIVSVVLEADSLTVRDNGPGLPESTIASSLDYELRVSDKILYVAPTRGQLGNALKAVWVLPYVVSGDSRGLVEVDARAVHHRIEINGTNQDPKILRSTKKSSVKNGTIIKVHWPQLASLQADSESADYYKVIAKFACLNPHSTFRLERPGLNPVVFCATAKDWQKRRMDQPTSAHWYRRESFCDLIAAYISHGQGQKTTREFVSEFAGLSGSQYQRKVIERAKVVGCSLAGLSEGAIGRLLEAMQKATRPVVPQRLGIIGEDHFRKTLLALGVAENSFEYKKKLGIENGLPFVVETAFGSKLTLEQERDLLLGLNFSPTFKVPSIHFENVLDECQIGERDSVVLAVHQVSPRLMFTSLGKGEIGDEKPSVREALSSLVESVTRRYTKMKRQAFRHHKQEIQQEHLGAVDEKRSEKEQLKTAAYACMAQAYRKASDDGRLPARPRQIMYAARPLVLQITGGKCWKNPSYFTQVLLPDYREEHPEETQNWNITYDPRGHLREPHTHVNFEIGTLEVREYRAAWRSNSASTYGPENRFRFALFIEKEGFDPLIEESAIAERFDLAFFSSKGVSVTAARTLVEELSNSGVTTLVVHDFDFSGFTILHTLGHDTRRYQFDTPPKVIDLGLRLVDVQKMDLDKEPVKLEQDKDPRIKLREYGALPDEIEFLVGGKHGYGGSAYWDGQRVELNAMTSRQFIGWLEAKLKEHGVEKVIPEASLLGQVWQSGHRSHAYSKFSEKRLKEIKEMVKEIEKDFTKQYKEPKTPKDLQKRVARHLKTDPAASWNAAISSIARVDALAGG